MSSRWMVDGGAPGSEDGPGPRGRIALFMVHGMGQQTPFDAISATVGGLRGLAGNGEPPPVLIDDPEARSVFSAGERLTFASFGLRRPGDREPRAELHVFEGYWAPQTEGIASLPEVISFLLQGGLAGIFRHRGRFTRWIYRRTVSFRVPFWTTLHLLAAVLVVVALVVLNALIVLVQGSDLVMGNPASPARGTLTVLVTIVLFLAATLGGTLTLTRGRLRTAAQAGSLVLFPATVVALVVGAALAVVAVRAGDCGGDAPVLRYCASTLRRLLEGDALDLVLGIGAWIGVGLLAFLLPLLVELGLASRRRPAPGDEPERITASFRTTRSVSVMSAIAIVLGLGFAAWLGFGTAARADQLPGRPASSAWLLTIAWVLLLALSARVRKLFLQYIGDVAIYVTSHSLDRFYETREEIRKTVLRTLRAIYEMKLDGKPGYDRVVVAGHSLGSVIVYDVMNRLIAEDLAREGPLDVLGRTPLLVTFGSPLDKTAYVFARQASEKSRIRDELAAITQPMIVDPGCRPERWINVWSPWDVVSGPLEYYDPPGWTGRRVDNREDHDAGTLLAAHLEYWNTAAIYRPIIEEVEDYLTAVR